MAITYWSIKGAPLTPEEVDGNFEYLDLSKVDKVLGYSLVSDAEIAKLATVQANAAPYTHPVNHPASIITQDNNNRFVTDTQIATWDAKQPAITAGNKLPLAVGGTYTPAFSPAGYNIANGLLALDASGYTPLVQTRPVFSRSKSDTGDLLTSDFGASVRSSATTDVVWTLPAASEVSGREVLIYKATTAAITIRAIGNDYILNSRPSGSLKMYNKASKREFIRIHSVGDGYLVDGYGEWIIDPDLST